MTPEQAARITVADIRSGEFCRLMGYHRFSQTPASPITPDWVVCIHCGYGENQPKALRLVKSSTSPESDRG